MRSSDELKKEWLKDEKFAEAYDLKRPLRIFIRAIKTARVEKGLSQKDLAGAIGTSQPVITRIEAGKQNISYEMTSKLSDTFGLRLYIFATSEEALTLPKELCDRLRKTTGTDESGEISDIVSSMLKSRLKIEKEVGKNLEFWRKWQNKIDQISNAYRINSFEAIRYALELGVMQWEKLMPEHRPDYEERCDEKCLAG